MKKRLLLLMLLPFLTYINNTQAQSNQITITESLFQQNLPVFPTRLVKTKPEIKGTVYVNNKFVAAKINNSKEFYQIRYNAFKDEMEVLGEGGLITLLDKTKDYIIRTYDNNNKMYQTVLLEDGNRGFAISLWVDADKNSLYIKENIIFTPKRPLKNSYEKEIPATFTRSTDDFFIKKAGSTSLVKISKNKKSFFTAFEGKEDEVKQFVQANDLEINDKDGLIKIMRFYFSS